MRKLCMQNMVWSYCKKISPEWKLQVSGRLQVGSFSRSFITPHHRLAVEQMEQKMTASDLFKDKKDNYPQSVPKLFVGTRLSKSQHSLLCSTTVTATKRSYKLVSAL